MEVSLVLNGSIKRGAWFKRHIRGTVIAVDGGAHACKKFGITPEYVVGDFDSISKTVLSAFKKTSTVIHLPNQNRTDFQKALTLAKKLKATHIRVFGAFGKDIDHEFANILSLTPNCVMVDERHEVSVVEKRIEVQGKKNDVVSVIALTPVKGLSYAGLKWPVSGLSVPAGWTGVRNRLVKKTSVISLSRGRIAVIRVHS